ncbi:recombinase RecT [Spiractinospora alimapuensis]|uniref:recombinase RecT n=1 Tax=Spiractinospora alimapuensis TaxID=2820884 RepID=UPI001F16F2E9|nr:recombinase RecT [Spiractinospora alimapuensis]QVQ51322.1 recombinase RecT [Spiractinospora alimapuensis]
MTETITNAVAKRESGPGAMVEQYRADLTQVMPTHVKPAQWVRLAQGVLRRDPKLAQAAANNPGALMTALMEAAQQGLTPGTAEYYLTPRKRKGQLEVQGITGWQGLVELMHRAGAISSVVAEIVHEADRFDYAPGRHDRPVHEIDWDTEDRGRMRLVYAYAVMKDGAVSKVIVLNRAHIAKIRAQSDGADSQYSPWQRWEESMWLKSAVRQLAKWIPTSSEYRREQLRAAQDVANEQHQAPSSSGSPAVDEDTGEVYDAELVDPATSAEPTPTESAFAAGAE